LLGTFTKTADRTTGGESLPDWLLTWADVAKSRWTEILIGNGCSRAISDSFRYSTLLKVAAGLATPRLTPEADAIFRVLDASDFEAVLRALSQTAAINSILRLPTDGLSDCYDSIRDSLVASISTVHPTHAAVTDSKLDSYKSFLREFSSIFTTNYDLLIYWAIMRDYKAFVDYFWSARFNFVFDITNTKIYNRTTKTRVLYLHGALMLGETDEGDAQKIVNEEGKPLLLDRIADNIERGYLPVFVSEGYGAQKIRSISKHTYLEFALGQLRNSGDPLIVLGHGLNGKSDGHILDAIARSGRQRICVGPWPRESVGELFAEKERISSALEGGASRTISFFDSRTVNYWGT